MTSVQDVVPPANSGGHTAGLVVDSPRPPRTGSVANHRNVSFHAAPSTVGPAQLPAPDLRVRGLSTESTAPTTTTKFQLIPRRATTGAFHSVWRTSRVAGCSPRLTQRPDSNSHSDTVPRSRSTEMERNHP